MVGDELQVKLLNREGGAWIVDSGVTGLKRARLCGGGREGGMCRWFSSLMGFFIDQT